MIKMISNQIQIWFLIVKMQATVLIKIANQ